MRAAVRRRLSQSSRSWPNDSVTTAAGITMLTSTYAHTHAGNAALLDTNHEALSAQLPEQPAALGI